MNKRISLCVRMKEQEYTDLKQLADDEELTISQFIKELIKKYKREQLK